MNTMRLAPGFRFEFRDLAKGYAVFLASITAIVVFSFFGSRALPGVISFSGYGFAAAVCFFIFGIVTPRSNLRMCLQLGVSRRTAFLSQLLSLLSVTLLSAAAGELLFAIFQSFNAPEFFLKDLYQLLYLDENVLRMSVGQHCTSLIFNTALMLCAFAGGMFITFLFWRLNKTWTIIVAAGVPLLVNVIPAVAYATGWDAFGLGRALAALFGFMAASAWNCMGVFLLLALLLSLVAWLLVRRANIRAPQGH